MKKLQELPEKQLKSTHFTENDMFRRLSFYRKINNKDTGKPNLLSFFEENTIEILIANLEKLDLKAQVDKLRAFIERKGDFKNYQFHEKIAENNRLSAQEKVYQEKREKIKAGNRVMEEKEKEKRDLAEEEYKLKVEDFRKQEKNILDSRSLPLRFFLFL